MVQSSDLLITTWFNSTGFFDRIEDRRFLQFLPVIKRASHYIADPSSSLTPDAPMSLLISLSQKTSESAFAPQFTHFHAPFPKAEFFVIPPSRQCFWTETHSPQAYLCAWEDGEILYLFPGRSNDRLLIQFDSLFRSIWGAVAWGFPNLFHLSSILHPHIHRGRFRIPCLYLRCVGD